MNCWEFKSCGREPNGKNIKEYGVCPAAAEKHANGINRGKNGGRCCWAIVGTLCGGIVNGGFNEKIALCSSCEFYGKVWKEEQDYNYLSPSQIIRLLSRQ